MNPTNEHLTPDEKAALRSQLVAFTASHPSAVAFRPLRHVAAYVAAFVLAGAGTALGFAQRSLPGDPLYPVRVAVNERVSVSLVADEEERLEREAELLAQAMDEDAQVAADALAQLALADDDPDGVPGPVDADAGLEAEFDAELDAMEALLADTEAAADLELSF